MSIVFVSAFSAADTSYNFCDTQGGSEVGLPLVVLERVYSRIIIYCIAFHTNMLQPVVVPTLLITDAQWERDKCA